MKKVIKILQYPFDILSSVRIRMIFTLGMAVFCVLFLFLFVPFNITSWIGYTSPFESLSLAGVALVGSLIIFLSQSFQALIWRNKKIKLYHLLAGFLLDVLSLTVPLSILYAAPGTTLITEIGQTLCLILPIIGLWYIIGLSVIALVTRINADTEKMIPAPTSPLRQDELIKIIDEHGEIRLSLWPGDLLYIESADNYVLVYFRKGEKVAKELIRNSLKNMEQHLTDAGCIRCHRSFLVNLLAISCFRKKGRSYVIDIKWAEKVIPVSRGYVSLIKDMLS